MIVTENMLNMIIYIIVKDLKLYFIESAFELETWQYNASNVPANAISGKKNLEKKLVILEKWGENINNNNNNAFKRD